MNSFYWLMTPFCDLRPSPFNTCNQEPAMQPVFLRKSLLALAIAATAAHSWAAPADLVISTDQSISYGLSGAFDSVTINSGVKFTSITPSVETGYADILITSAAIGNFINRGTITATESNTLGLLITSGGRIDVLDNYGTISGVAQGISVGTTASTSLMAINQHAGSLSSIWAAPGKNVTLNWNGGAIGKLQGLKTFNLNLDHASLTNSNLTMADGSTIRMRLTADNSIPVLSLGSGQYNLGTGSQVLLRPSTNNFSVNNQTYTLIQASSGAANAGLNVLSESPYLTVHSWNAGNNLTATVSIASAQQAGGNIGLAGGSRNAQAAGAAIAPLLSSMASRAPNDPVLQALASSDAVTATEQLVPDVNGGALHAANNLNSQADLNAGERTQNLRGASAGDAFVERGLWMKALNSNAKQHKRSGIEGFKANSNGISIGADGKLNDQLTLGLAYSYLNSDINSIGGNKTEIDGHAITLYSGYEQGAWFLDSSLTIGLNHNDSQRYIAGTSAKADYDSQMFGFNALTGYGFVLDNGLQVEPRAAARYGRVDIDSYTEKGSLAALNVGSQRYEVAELGAGLRIAGYQPLGQGKLKTHAKVMVFHDFAADQVSSSASFVFGGAPFFANGATPARTRYEVGMGVDYKLAAFTLGMSYDYSSKQDFNAHAFQVKMRYDF